MCCVLLLRLPVDPCRSAVETQEAGLISDTPPIKKFSLELAQIVAFRRQNDGAVGVGPGGLALKGKMAMNRSGMMLSCAVLAVLCTATIADSQSVSDQTVTPDTDKAASQPYTAVTNVPISADATVDDAPAASAQSSTDTTSASVPVSAAPAAPATPIENAPASAPATTGEPAMTPPADVVATGAPSAPTLQVAVAQPVPAITQPATLNTFLGQWKLNDGSTTTGIVQVTNAGKDATMTVVQETRYRVDWTLFGPPFPTNWPLLQGKVDDSGKVRWTYYDTVPGCWINKAVPVDVVVTPDQRRVDFQVNTYKAITCQPDEKAPVMAFKLTRQP